MNFNFSMQQSRKQFSVILYLKLFLYNALYKYNKCIVMPCNAPCKLMYNCNHSYSTRFIAFRKCYLNHAATGQRRQCAHHTPATGGEERESIKWMGIIRRP